MSVFDQINHAAEDSKIMENYRKASEWTELKARAECATANTEFEIAQAKQNRIKNLNRPCMMLGAAIDPCATGGFTASYDGVSADGDTPEIAFENFDTLWTQGRY